LNKLRRDDRGFVWLDDLKICRVTPQGFIEFFDRDKLRAEARGTQFVYADAGTLCRLLSGEVMTDGSIS